MDVRRTIGLSLGADLCWPIWFEQLLERLDLALPLDGQTVRFSVERLTIEPFDLRQPCKYDLVVDRLTHWYHTSREWIKKAILMDGLYVLNNPWSLQSMEKHTTYCAMMQLGLPLPDTWMIPPKEYDPTPDLQPTLMRYAKLFDLGEIGRQLGYPSVMKPYDGGGWRSVSKVDDVEALKRAYEDSGNTVMHLQAAIHPWDRFVRCIGIGPQIRHVLYDPRAPLHDRYTFRRDEIISGEEASLLEDITLTINAFFGWEFNSCESMRNAETGVWHPIDFANACPDSQVTSLHYHFPWLVKSMLRWTIFCAATKRKMRRNLDWDPFYEIAAEPGLDYRDRVRAYADVARSRLAHSEFFSFCETHLGHFDEVANAYFATDAARDAVRQKVAAMYPAHEVDTFTELFWSRIQASRADEEAAA